MKGIIDLIFLSTEPNCQVTLELGMLALASAWGQVFLPSLLKSFKKKKTLSYQTEEEITGICVEGSPVSG